MGVHYSQAYRKMDVTKERISRILEVRELRLSFQLVSTLSVLLLSVLSWRVSRAWNPHQLQLSQVLEACDCLKLLSIHFDLCVDVTGVVCHQLGLLGTDLHAVRCGGFVKMFN